MILPLEIVSGLARQCPREHLLLILGLILESMALGLSSWYSRIMSAKIELTVNSVDKMFPCVGTTSFPAMGDILLSWKNMSISSSSSFSLLIENLGLFNSRSITLLIWLLFLPFYISLDVLLFFPRALGGVFLVLMDLVRFPDGVVWVIDSVLPFLKANFT